ncbi:hypothetical protein DOY81_007981 [Sarcophaga bullata]|nr:hypothetical protein DOY81_007981 [Sarcophaga bullata]
MNVESLSQMQNLWISLYCVLPNSATHLGSYSSSISSSSSSSSINQQQVSGINNKRMPSQLWDSVLTHSCQAIMITMITGHDWLEE